MSGGNLNNGVNAGVANRNANNTGSSNRNENLGRRPASCVFRPSKTLPLGKTNNVSQHVGRETEDLGINTSTMKRYGNLYSKIYDRENIMFAHQNARRGKRFYREVQMVDENPEKYINEIHEMLKNKTFRNAKYERFQREEGGKLRDIAKLPYYPDRIIHHYLKGEANVQFQHR